ncbi:Uncharacterised protein [Bartonella vinsonii]|uniref:Uncharacterized protein n=1 Tax=Bartonella vinsonii TaxID=33047 RepID=A0A3S4YTS7_BARVI|nr:Uncharacterised protein [Bartonella vinsonii]
MKFKRRFFFTVFAHSVSFTTLAQKFKLQIFFFLKYSSYLYAHIFFSHTYAHPIKNDAKNKYESKRKTRIQIYKNRLEKNNAVAFYDFTHSISSRNNSSSNHSSSFCAQAFFFSSSAIDKRSKRSLSLQ